MEAVMIDTEEKARKKVNDTWNADELFIILSESKYKDGRSVPRAFAVSEKIISLSVFTTYSAAVDFCKDYESLKADGKFLIGRIDNADKLRDLYSVLNTALYLGIGWTDIDSGTEEAIGINIRTMFDWGGREVDSVSMLMSKAEYERVASGGKIDLRFNEIPLYEPIS